ncbi:MAG: BatA domain-containing protein [Gemmatimonadales bacterium]
MGFLQPLALFALAASAIPTLLHLLARRLPPVFVFPAVRYLTATEREHSRRLKLRNILLLVMRTLIIILLVLAAARPVVRVASGNAHPPTALAVVVDNSLSSGAVDGGRLMLDALVEAAGKVLDRVNSGDHLWIALADGIPRRMTKLHAKQLLDSLAPSPLRLDLGSAVRVAARTVMDDRLDGHELVVFSDVQASAISPGEPSAVPALFWRPPDPPENRWMDSVRSDPPLWSPSGAVVASIMGSARRPAAVHLTVLGSDIARAVAATDQTVVLTGRLRDTGWMVATVELDPDELRADDRRFVALHVATPAKAKVRTGAGRFVREAIQVLADGGRVVPGDEVALDDELGAQSTILFPPGDPALLGSLNRTLVARGVGWQFGDVIEGEWQLPANLTAGGGTAVYRRYSLEGSGPVIAALAGDPWLVRDGNVVLLASRMEPEWTDLPVSAAFVPFLDFLVSRVAATESWVVQGAPGDVTTFPPGASALLVPEGRVPIPSDGKLGVPLRPGVYFFLGQSGDTLGALEVNYDARESRLDPAGLRLLKARLGSDTRLLNARQLDGAVFRGAHRADITGLMLLASLLVAVAEFAVASWGGRTMSST